MDMFCPEIGVVQEPLFVYDPPDAFRTKSKAIEVPKAVPPKK